MPKLDNGFGAKWDIKEYLRSVAKDPDSLVFISYTYPVITYRGWLVVCEYRGKNGFGGYSFETKGFIFQQGKLIYVIDN
jgi:hypothetical protein